MTAIRNARSLFLMLALFVAFAAFVLTPTTPAADLSVTAANVVPDSGYAYQDVTAGATITAGQVVYLDTSAASVAKLADCNASKATAAARGIALHGAASGQPLRVMTGGTITIGATTAVGQVYVVSGTAGGVAPYGDLGTGDYVTILGVGTTTAKIQLSIFVTNVQKP